MWNLADNKNGVSMVFREAEVNVLLHHLMGSLRSSGKHVVL